MNNINDQRRLCTRVYAMSENTSNPLISIGISKDIEEKKQQEDFARVKQPKVEENVNLYCNINET